LERQRLEDGAYAVLYPNRFGLQNAVVIFTICFAFEIPLQGSQGRLGLVQIRLLCRQQRPNLTDLLGIVELGTIGDPLNGG
jgi:hypothetical protein